MSTMTNRTDIHSPKNFDPAAYSYVGSFDNFPEVGAFMNNVVSDFDTPFGPIKALTFEHSMYVAGHHLIETEGAKIHFVDGNSQCDHCGTRIRYVSIYRHSSGEVIAVGDTCAEERFGCADRRQYDIKRLREAAASTRESQKAFGAASTFINESAPELAEWMLSPVANDVHPIFADISRKLIRFGSISEKQIQFARRLLQEHFERQRNGGKSDRELGFEKERESAEDCPQGRIQITGTILKSEWKETDFGGSLKITVKDDRGFIVWMTCPSNLGGERGSKIQVTATVEPSDRDPKFGFGKRPAKGSVIESDQSIAESLTGAL